MISANQTEVHIDVAAIIARPATDADCLDIAKLDYAMIDIDSQQATEEVRLILAEPFGFGTVVRQGDQLLGALAAVLVKPWFSNVIRTSGRPFFHEHVREATKSPFPTEREVGLANAGQGLDLVTTHFAVDGRLDEVTASRVYSILVDSYVSCYAGNKVRSILVETLSELNAERALRTGYDPIETFDDWRSQNKLRPGDSPCLFEVTLESALFRNNYYLVRLLNYRAPKLRFPPAAREVLRYSIQGMSDSEQMRRFGFTEATITSRWARIFDIFERKIPQLDSVGSAIQARRSRAAVLEYIRSNPEELWPYEPSRKK